MADLAPFPWIDVAIIVALILINAVFAMSEMAVVSARPSRLQAMAENGNVGAAAAVKLTEDPGKFLSTVQIGITLVGIVAGAYSGASLGGPMGDRLALLGMDPDIADAAGFALIIGLTTYGSLVIGELVPKQFALAAPEVISSVIAIPMQILAIIAAPVVWLLDSTTALVFRILGLNRNKDKSLSAEELHMLFHEAKHAGVIEEQERAMIAGVVRLADRPVREVMTPRPEVDWLPIDADAATIHARLIASPHSRLLVARGTADDIAGVVQARDVVAALIAGKPLDLTALMRVAEVVPDRLDAMDALTVLRSADVPMLLVHDEYGHFEGIVTPADLLSAIAGEFASDQQQGSAASVVVREDGSLLIAGGMAADTMADRLAITLPDDRDYATAAGHALTVLRRLPKEGDFFVDQGWRFEIVDMDGRKIDKLLVSRIE